MRVLPVWVFFVAVMTTTTTGASQSASAGRTPIDVSKLGPQIGERVPDFDLPDQHGKRWTLQSLMGPRGCMLVFVRSADW
jgi:hypothetical protein